MLNKELLLIPSLAEKDLEYSHTIIVGQDGDFVGFSVTEPAFGSITPNTFLNVEIQKISCRRVAPHLGTAIAFNKVPNVDTVYIGRTDTKKFVTLYHLGGGSPVFMTNKNEPFFTDIDVGKEIKLWIGKNPPPW